MNNDYDFDVWLVIIAVAFIYASPFIAILICIFLFGEW